MSSRPRAGLPSHATFDPEDGDDQSTASSDNPTRRPGWPTDYFERLGCIHARPDQQCRCARAGSGGRTSGMAPYWQSSERRLRQAHERDSQGGVLAHADRGRGGLAGDHALPRHRDRHRRAQGPGRRADPHLRRRRLRPGAHPAGARRRVPDQRAPHRLRHPASDCSAARWTSTCRTYAGSAPAPWPTPTRRADLRGLDRTGPGADDEGGWSCGGSDTGMEVVRHELRHHRGRHRDLLQGLGRAASPSCSTTAGRSARTTGTPR